jgi:hypothetical protein
MPNLGFTSASIVDADVVTRQDAEIGRLYARFLMRLRS